MTAEEIVHSLSTFGFPTVAAIVMWRVLEARTKKSEEQCQKVQSAQESEIIYLRHQYNDLEQYIRSELTKVVSEKNNALTACASVLQDVREYLKAK